MLNVPPTRAPAARRSSSSTRPGSTSHAPRSVSGSNDTARRARRRRRRAVRARRDTAARYGRPVGRAAAAAGPGRRREQGRCRAAGTRCSPSSRRRASSTSSSTSTSRCRRRRATASTSSSTTSSRGCPRARSTTPTTWSPTCPRRSGSPSWCASSCWRIAREELPHSIATRVTEWEWPYIRCEMLVERESQKGIVIGKGGAILKAVGTAVREQLPPGAYLDLHVKVDKDWQRRPCRPRSPRSALPETRGGRRRPRRGPWCGASAGAR